MDPWSSATSIAAAVAAGRTTAGAVVERALERIGERDSVLNAFTAVTRERARSRARRPRHHVILHLGSEH